MAIFTTLSVILDIINDESVNLTFTRKKSMGAVTILRLTRRNSTENNTDS